MHWALHHHAPPPCAQVVAFLRTLGLKDDHLNQRVLCVCPSVLCRDVESQLRPVVLWLMQMGIEVRWLLYVCDRVSGRKGGVRGGRRGESPSHGQWCCR